MCPPIRFHTGQSERYVEGVAVRLQDAPVLALESDVFLPFRISPGELIAPYGHCQHSIRFDRASVGSNECLYSRRNTEIILAEPEKSLISKLFFSFQQIFDSLCSFVHLEKGEGRMEPALPGELFYDYEEQ